MSLTDSCVLILGGTDAGAILGGRLGAGGVWLEKQVSWDGPWGLEPAFLPVPPVPLALWRCEQQSHSCCHQPSHRMLGWTGPSEPK